MEEERKVVVLNIDDILPNRFQPRIKFSENAINELAESIKLHGVIQPIVVRKISDKYEIIAGERRYKASIIAGKTTIPAIVTTLDDKNSAEVALIENVQRQDLTPIEEAISYKKILDMGYLNQEELGSKLGKKQSTIANKLRLLNLNDEVQEALMENKISERHARSLLRLNDKMQVIMLNRIISERLTVRKTDEEIAKLLSSSETDSPVGTVKEKEKVKEEKGENNMNNDILNDFNIPTEPIINDKEEDSIVFEDQPTEIASQPISQPEPVSMVQENPLPSFESVQPTMSVETPVEVPTPAPVEPVVPVDVPEMPTFEPVVENVQPEPVEEQPVVNPGFMDIDKIENVAQDIVKEPEPVADMGELLKPDENIQPVDTVVEQQPIVEEQPQRTGKFFDMFNFPSQTPAPSFVENVEDQQVNMDFTEPTVENNINPIENTDVFNQPVQPTMSVETPVEVPTPASVEPVAPVDVPEMPTFEPVAENVQPQPAEVQPEPFTSSVQPMALTDDDDFKSMDVINQPQTVDSSIQRPYMMDDSVKFDDEGEIEVQLPEQNIKRVAVDMKTVINTIRDCAATIEKYGYKVDTDELDLADCYEVTFRIEKDI